MVSILRSVVAFFSELLRRDAYISALLDLLFWDHLVNLVLARLGTSWTNIVHFFHFDILANKSLIAQWAPQTINSFCA